MSGRDILLNELNALTAPDTNIIRKATENLDRYSKERGYGIILLEICFDSSLPRPIRQSSILLLKQYVKKHWSDTGDKFEEPMVDNADKEKIRSILPHGLGDQEEVIRTGVSTAIATIATFDWPDHWPNILNDLFLCASKGDKQNNQESVLASGAMKCLDIFCDGENGDENISDLMNLLFPPMLEILNEQNKSKYSEKFRASAVYVMKSLVAWLTVMKEERKQDVRLFFDSIAPKLFPKCVQILSEQFDPRTDDNSLRNSTLQLLLELFPEYPKYCKTYLQSALPPLWLLFTKGSSLYQSWVVSIGEDDSPPDAWDGTDNAIGVHDLLANLLQLILSFIEDRSYIKYLRNAVPQLVSVMLVYAQMSQEQIQEWTEDVDKYVGEEEEVLAEDISLRTTAINAILMICGVDCEEDETGPFGEEGLTHALSSCWNVLNRPDAKTDPNFWKAKEAVLFILGNVSEELIQRSEELKFDYISFLTSLLPDLHSNQHPLLKGRIIWLGGKFAKVLNTDLHNHFFQLAVESIKNPSEQLIVKISACRGLSYFCLNLGSSASKLIPMLDSAIPSIFEILDQCGDNTLHLVLECLLTLVKADVDATARWHQGGLTQKLGKVWNDNGSRPFIPDIMGDIMGCLASNPHCSANFQELISHPISSILKVPDQNGTMTQISIRVTEGIIKESIVPSETFLRNVLPPLLALLNNNSETGYIDAGTRALLAFVNKIPKELSIWKIEGDVTALQLILRFIAKTLQNDNDNAVIPIGTLISTLIWRLSSEVSTILSELLQAIVHRLRTARLPTLVQSLILVFARLFHSQTVEVSNFLAGLKLPPTELYPTEDNALHFVLWIWTKHAQDFHGVYRLKVSTLSLAKIFETLGDQLNSIKAEGEQIPNTDPNVIMTRSRAKTAYTELNMREKIFRVILDEQRTAQEEEDEKNRKEDTDEEYDSEEEGSDGYNAIAKELGSRFLDAGYFDDTDDEFEEEDDIAKEDPLNQIGSLKEWIENWLKAFSANQNSLFVSLAENLGNDRKESLKRVFGASTNK